ncbi:MAG: threonine--tRNA ligase [Clostridia bacterium]|nr:threonine--tRNA ligase [Clostridia bacterium]
MKIKLRDEVREFESGVSTLDIAKSISEGLARVAVCGKVGEELIDLNLPIKEDCALEIITTKSPEYQEVLRHSTAHVLAQAVKTIFPTAKCWVGPATKDGFYYDFDFKTPITNEDLAVIEDEMNKIIKANFEIVRKEVSKKEAIKLMKEAGEPYKVELIEGIADDEPITTYTQGDYIEVCRGPHIKSTGIIKAFKLTKISGAYLKGDSKNKMLTRIYGVVFEKKSELDEYFRLLEEAMKRDHRKIGKELDLFFFDETAPGMAYWLPKGFTLMNTLINYWREIHKKNGYQEFSGPQLNSSVLWKTSGHWDHYKDDMFVLTDSDGAEQALKPMNCPNSIKVFQSKTRSYKDLPLRFNDVDVIHRNEKSGQLNGLFRVRMFRQDDSHNFVTADQIGSEIKEILSIADKMYKDFNLPYVLTLSTRPDDFMGEIATWNKAEAELKEVLNNLCGEGNYRINEGDGAFYGPKIDIKMKDCLGREWQMGTVQVDFQLPSRFDLSYIASDGTKQMPIMLHRAILGSFDRFIGIITEHFAGAFPTWLAPVQAKVISVSEKSAEYANKVAADLEEKGIRVELDNSDERIGYKIRSAQMEKVPYMFILGENESSSGKVSIRKRNGEEIKDLSFEDAVAMIKEDVESKKI